MTPFALATVQTGAGPAAALRIGEQMYALAAAEPALAGASVRTLLDDWFTMFPRLCALADQIAADPVAAKACEMRAPTVLSPNLYPDKLMAVGANYSGHLEEMGLQATKWASMPFFLRPPKTTLVGPGETVHIPASTKQFDWECELVVFVGRRLRHASTGEAAAAVAGYAIGLDLSCRDLIEVDNDLKVDLVRGKAQDTMAPCGPWLTPATFAGNPDGLRIQLSVNGQQMMDASTSEMIYKIDEQLSIISEYLTIEPGDMLFTGSPAGSAGEHGDRWLVPGDSIHATIGDIGPLDVRMAPR
jgi:2-keto-4-pentenoate hydratase/2-oxohepta-3-ene-1,7-dioic acid hydratase in catechol pathway